MSEEEVLAYVADARFHRVFHLPANPSKQREKPLRVSYSDVGRAQCANDEEEARKPTIFFCGGFFAGRYLPLSLGADAVLKARGVRFITIDKPGMGGTEPVPLNRRVDIYLDIVAALLAHLKVRHVSLACHSGGIVYAFNLMVYQRQILHPLHPTVDMFAPWVHQSHLNYNMLKIWGQLPRALLANYHNVVSFVYRRVNPVLALSDDVISMVFRKSDELELDDDQGTEGENRLLPTTEERQLEKQVLAELQKYIPAEDFAGISDELQLLLKRTGGKDPWGSWGDIDRIVPILAEQEKKHRREMMRSGKPVGSVLKVKAYYASRDGMVGKSGAKWLSSSFTAEACQGVVSYESEIWPKTTHDGILLRRAGLLEKWIEDVAALYAEA